VAAPDDIPAIALSWLDERRDVAIATVLRTWGSAPRPAGSMLVVDGTMNFEGSVSGGCVESAVISEALESFGDGIPRILTFGVADETAFEVGLACGGEIAIMVEPVAQNQGISRADLEALVSARQARRAVLREVDTTTWQGRIVARDKADASVEDQFRRDRTLFEDGIFRAVFSPPLRLAIIGAVHIAGPLATMARLAGYDVALCDPRSGFASSARFPGETFLDDWPDEALRGWQPDARSAVVTLSHDPKIDTPALRVALASKAFYIGSLGSTRTHGKRRAELEGLGVADNDIARIKGPVGLDIGAATPAEIAISIMAEMTQSLRRPDETS